MIKQPGVVNIILRLILIIQLGYGASCEVFRMLRGFNSRIAFPHEKVGWGKIKKGVFQV